jgi:hypothetical protein
MCAARVGSIFVKARVPYLLVPEGGKRVAARIAKDFEIFINGVANGYNEKNGTALLPWEGLVELLNSNITPTSLFDQYRGMAEQAKGVFGGKWASEKGYDEGYKWMTPEFAKWFLYNVLGHPHKIDDFTEFNGAPDLRKVLIEHPRGEGWMVEFVEQLRGFLYPGH